MKKLTQLAPVLATVLLCGCFQVEDELVLQPDGSGTVTMKVHSNVPDQLAGAMGVSSRYGGGSPMYPPINEGEARRFFPAKDFTVKVEQKSADDGKTLMIEARFKDINTLLASLYGRAHQLSLQTNGSTLQLLALTGGAALAQASQFKAEGEMTSFEMPGMEDAQKQKKEMRLRFRITFPNPVATANGAREDKSVTWDIERAKCKDDDEFAAKLGEVLEAACSSEGLRFTPVTPPRLGLLPFNRLAAQKAAAAAPGPDTNKIAAAAKFIPYVLSVTRSLDLSGEGSTGASQAQLTGAILLPPEFAPQRWGEPRLEEATDSKGNNLMPKEGDESAGFQRDYFGHLGEEEQADDEGDETTPRPEPAQKPHIISFSFKAPEWKTKEIARIKGAVDLQYLGGTEVIKLTNAVPPNLVIDMSQRSFSGMSFDSSRGQISNPRLAELGLTLQVQMAMVQSGSTILSLQTGGGKAALTDAQVFDADGRPWPTTLMQSDSGAREESSCQLMVAGKPKPPLSLALAVGGVGASVSVPILLEKVPVGDK